MKIYEVCKSDYECPYCFKAFTDKEIAEQFKDLLEKTDKEQFEDEYYFIREKEVLEEKPKMFLKISIHLDPFDNSISSLEEVFFESEFDIHSKEDCSEACLFKIYEVNEDFDLEEEIRKLKKEFNEKNSQFKYFVKIGEEYLTEESVFESEKDYSKTDYIFGLFDFSDKDNPVLIQRIPNQIY